MRVEYINTVTRKTGGVNIPPGKNPVRIGQHNQNDVVLDSPYIGSEAITLEHDVAQGKGWRVWNRNGRPIRVNDVLLTDIDHVTPLPSSPATIHAHPYVITVTLTDTVLPESDVAMARLNEDCARFIQEVHRKLVDLHPEEAKDPSRRETEEYIHTLETEITELAGQHAEFPADDTRTTELSGHLAGIAVRSLLLARIDNPSARGPSKTEAAWVRARTAIPECDAQMAVLCERARRDLGLDAIPDLTARVRQVEKDYWAWWAKTRTEGRLVSPRLARYLALRRLIKEIKDIWFGLGPLQELFDDPNINEIMVVGRDKIFVEKNKQIEETGRRFFTDPNVVVQRLVGQANREINTGAPMVDVRLHNGSRVNVVVDPLALNGPFITIRRFPEERVTVDDLVKVYKSLTPAARDFLEAVVRNQCNVIVAGGTGTGKTTMLNCLSGFIPDKQRIVTVEDTAELQLKKQHVLTLQTRNANSDKKGEVTIRDLVRNSLRMRPDRIVVGECRGGEAIDMLQAMNTGHDGSMTTLHANTPEGVIRRLEVLVQQNSDSTLPVESIHAQIASAVDIIVQLGTVERLVKGKLEKCKVVKEIVEVLDVKPGGVTMVSLFKRDLDGELRATGSLPTFLPEMIAGNLVTSAVDFVRHAMSRE
jgi:Flp pilus assembly CpaF family ATPase